MSMSMELNDGALMDALVQFLMDRVLLQLRRDRWVCSVGPAS